MWCLRTTKRLGWLCETCSAESGVLGCNACLAGVRPDVQSQALTETERNQHHDSKSIEVHFFFLLLLVKKKSLKDTPSLVSLYLVLIYPLLNYLNCASSEVEGGKGQYRGTPQQPSFEFLFRPSEKFRREATVDRRTTPLNAPSLCTVYVKLLWIFVLWIKICKVCRQGLKKRERGTNIGRQYNIFSNPAQLSIRFLKSSVLIEICNLPTRKKKTTTKEGHLEI